MQCLQCDKAAKENGETYEGVNLRECVGGHRTGLLKGSAQKRKALIKGHMERKAGVYALKEVA